MKNRGSNPILTNLVGDHPRNIHTKFEANPCSGLRGEVEKLNSSRRQRTQPDRYSHTHSLSVTKNFLKCSLVLRKSTPRFLLVLGLLPNNAGHSRKYNLSLNFFLLFLIEILLVPGSRTSDFFTPGYYSNVNHVNVYLSQ